MCTTTRQVWLLLQFLLFIHFSLARLSNNMLKRRTKNGYLYYYSFHFKIPVIAKFIKKMYCLYVLKFHTYNDYTGSFLARFFWLYHIVVEVLEEESGHSGITSTLDSCENSPEETSIPFCCRAPKTSHESLLLKGTIAPCSTSTLVTGYLIHEPSENKTISKL